MGSARLVGLIAEDGFFFSGFSKMKNFTGSVRRKEDMHGALKACISQKVYKERRL